MTISPSTVKGTCEYGSTSNTLWESGNYVVFFPDTDTYHGYGVARGCLWV